MTLLVIRRAAEADILAVQRWYEVRDPELAVEFAAEIQGIMASLQEFPKAHRVTHRDVRRALLHRFPYSLFYRADETRVVVLGCFHHRRSPTRWLSRR